ncbi:MAG: hypothetical protein GXY77_20315 [Fibrobacter sp.]|nr:hypothetical protein [Fibrobacter sp.]
MINNYFTRLLLKLIPLINRLFPKKNKAIFSSESGYTDNARAMYEYISRNKDVEVVWVFNKLTEEVMAKKYGVTVKRNTFHFIYHIFTSRYIFTTHFEFINLVNDKKQLYINLWHGMPFKNIELLDQVEPKKSHNHSLKILRKIRSYSFVNSEFYRLVFSASFDLQVNKVVALGQPRIDFFFNDKPKPKFIEKYSKVLLYCPTYRNSSGKYKRNDSGWNINRFKKACITKKFVNFLEKENYLFIIKLHPFEKNTLNVNTSNDIKNILEIKSDYLLKNNTDLYELLKYTDLLITDYSSIFIDYMILNRPIIYLIEDYDEYTKSRTFLLNKFEQFSPGHIIKTASKLIPTIKEALINDPYKLKRSELNKLINDKLGQHSICKKITDFLNIM